MTLCDNRPSPNHRYQSTTCHSQHPRTTCIIGIIVPVVFIIIIIVIIIIIIIYSVTTSTLRLTKKHVPQRDWHSNGPLSPQTSNPETKHRMSNVGTETSTPNLRRGPQGIYTPFMIVNDD